MADSDVTFVQQCIRKVQNMTVTLVTLPDGNEIDASEAICKGCGSDLAGHSCGGSTGSGSTVYVRRSGPTARVAPAAAPTCAHCGGRLHQNGSALEVNAPCWTRQYALDQGLMSTPFDKIPAHLATIEGQKEVLAWAESLASPISYGKMTTAAGGAGTYAGLKPKVGRKKKAAPAAPGAQIQDMAADEEIEATEKPKAKRGRKPKAAVVADVEEMLAETSQNGVSAPSEESLTEVEEALAAAEAALAADDEEEAVTAPAPTQSAEERRAARQARRRAALSGKA